MFYININDKIYYYSYNKLEDRYFEVQQTDEVNGYRCSICNTEIEEDMVNEIVRLNSFVD